MRNNNLNRQLQQNQEEDFDFSQTKELYFQNEFKEDDNNNSPQSDDSIILDENEITHILKPLPRNQQQPRTLNQVTLQANKKIGIQLSYLNKITPQIKKIIENTQMINLKNDDKDTNYYSSSNNSIQKQNQFSPKNTLAKRINDLEFFQQKFQAYLNSLPEPVEPHKDLIYQYDQPDPEIKYANLDKQGIIALYRNAQFPQWQLEKGTKEVDLRANCASSGGGKKCLNKTVIEKLRATAKGLLKELGSQILQGKIDLTRLSFPIKTMNPMSGLEKALNSACLFPYYMNRAYEEKDPVERLKLVICATIGHFFINLSFTKPLNPILGETCYGTFPDGSELYAEQISHHPPITYVTVYGMDKNYFFQGYYNYSSSAGLNSLSLKNSGKRSVTFKDGGKINYNFGNENYCGTFWGSTKIECVGKIQFTDEQNDISAKIEFDKGGIGKPSDFIEGTIKRGKNEKLCKIRGSFMGFLLFDEKLYWSYKQQIAVKPQIKFNGLESDHFYRNDKNYLQIGHGEKAQEEKENMENMQRHDRKLREEFEKEQKKLKKQQKK